MIKILSLLIFLFVGTYNLSCNKKSVIHNAHRAGTWYSKDKATLESKIKDYFDLAQKHFTVTTRKESVKAIIAPHAGHYYSGLCAASVYQIIRDNNFEKVIILGPSHAYDFEGIALPDYSIYRTPLGDLPVDMSSIETLKAHKLFDVKREAHDPEHSIEIQLPFLQVALKKISIVPIVVGKLEEDDFDTIVQELEKVITSKTLLIISSDFIHYGPRFNYTPFTKDIFYNIRQYDSEAIEAITLQSHKRFYSVLKKHEPTICGRNGIRILLKLIERGTLGKVHCRLASYYTSQQLQQAHKNRSGAIKDITIAKLFEAHDDISSVSYAGLVFTQDTPKSDFLTGYEKRALLKLARDIIQNQLKTRKLQKKKSLLYPPLSLGLQQTTGAFVTLKKLGNLRGCIGRIQTTGPLYKTIARMSKSSAFEDSRFSPVKQEELADITIEISVLTQPQRIKSYKDIKLGTHGIILKKGTARAVYLPQVPIEQHWDIDTTLQHLSQKAGLNKNAYKRDCEFEVFEAFKFGDSTISRNAQKIK